MTTDTLLWSYLATAVLLITHEIDSAYWKEWELFKLPVGITGFLLLHIPMLAVILYGLVLVVRQAPAGYWFSFALSIGGIFAFGIHLYFLWKGRKEFDAPISKSILGALLFISLVQLIFTLMAIGTH